MGVDINWQSLVFQTGWLQKLDKLSIKRFGDGGLAEEASAYVIDKLSSDDWGSLSTFKGQCKPESYLHTVTGNYLEEFSRQRFGRPRPPEWLKRQGELWVQVWKLVCLERQLIQSVVDHLTFNNLREPHIIKDVISTIKARLPWCGESNREVTLSYSGVDDCSYNPAEFIAYERTPEDDITETDYINTLLLISSLMNDDPVEDMFGQSATERAEDYVKKHGHKFEILQQKLELTDEERILLRMIFQDGMKKSVVAKSLGMQEHLPGRILQRVTARINIVFQELGINLDEIHEISIKFAR